MSTIAPNAFLVSIRPAVLAAQRLILAISLAMQRLII
jgi:hypothetical protein